MKYLAKVLTSYLTLYDHQQIILMLWHILAALKSS